MTQISIMICDMKLESEIEFELIRLQNLLSMDLEHGGGPKKSKFHSLSCGLICLCFKFYYWVLCRCLAWEASACIIIKELQIHRPLLASTNRSYYNFKWISCFAMPCQFVSWKRQWMENWRHLGEVRFFCTGTEK